MKEPLTVTDVLRTVVKFCVEHGQRESRFLTPYPQWQINSTALLEELVKFTDIAPEEIDAWCEEFNATKRVAA